MVVRCGGSEGSNEGVSENSAAVVVDSVSYNESRVDGVAESSLE